MVEDVQLLTYSSCTLPGLTGVYGCRDDDGGVEIQFDLQANLQARYMPRLSGAE